MGMQTNISILNDDFGWIQKNPKKFVDAIASGMNSGTAPLRRGGRWGEVNNFRSDEEREAVAHSVTVHQAHHADTPAVYFEQYNSSYDVYDLILALRRGFLPAQDNSDIWRNIIRDILFNLKFQTKELEKALKEAEAE